MRRSEFMMGDDGRPVSWEVMRVAGRLLHLLERGERTKPDLARLVGVSEMTVHRSLSWLRACDVPVFFDRSDLLWKLGVVEVALDVSLGELVKAGVLEEGEARSLALAATCCVRVKHRVGGAA